MRLEGAGGGLQDAGLGCRVGASHASEGAPAAGVGAGVDRATRILLEARQGLFGRCSPSCWEHATGGRPVGAHPRLLKGRGAEGSLGDEGGTA